MNTPNTTEHRSLLNAIRQRPPLYLGSRSLSALRDFLVGYQTALMVHSIKSDHGLDLPEEIHDWVAYRLHFRESTRGYTNMILERTGDEAAALERFFQLIDEYDQRVPRTVAKLAGFERHYFQGLGKKSQIKFYPSTILLVTYTDDPGFFVKSEDSNDRFPGRGFCPSLKSFELRFPKSGQLEIVDSAIYDRLHRESVTNS